MRIAYALLALALASTGLADTLTLKSGRVVTGTYLGGSSRQIRMEVANQIETFDVSDVATLQFASSSASPSPAPTSTPAQSNVLKPDPQPAAAAEPAGSVMIPAGTSLTVRMIDSIDSQTSGVGDTFQASMDEPVMVDGRTVIPRGSDVVVKLVDDKESGKLTGRTELSLNLVSVKVNGRMVDVNSQAVTQASDSRTAKTAKVATGGAALGAIIGAIAGGGKGAAIGAATGAGAGAGVQVLTKGQRVHIPSETRLTFTLDSAVRI